MLPVGVNPEAGSGMWIDVEVPVIEAVAVSVAVTVWVPAVFNVPEKVPVPFVKLEFAGSTAWPSVLVKLTIPV
jgi:hypothetical protein